MSLCRILEIFRKKEIPNNNSVAVLVAVFVLKNEWLEKIEECKKNFKLKLEQDVTRGDPSQTTLQSWYSSNPTLEDRKNPFFEDHHSNSKDEDCRNPIMESKSTNPFDEDENNPFSQGLRIACKCKSVTLFPIFLQGLLRLTGKREMINFF